MWFINIFCCYMYALTLLTYFETFWFFLVSGCDAVSWLQCPLHERDGLCCHALPLRIHVPCDSTAANLHVLCRTSKWFGEENSNFVIFRASIIERSRAKSCNHRSWERNEKLYCEVGRHKTWFGFCIWSGSTAVTVSHDLQKLATNYTRLSAEWCNKDRVIEVLYCKEK